MEEFDDHGEFDVVAGFVTASAAGEQNHQGSQTLSATFDDVLADLFDQTDIRSEQARNQRVGRLEVLEDECVHRLERADLRSFQADVVGGYGRFPRHYR